MNYSLFLFASVYVFIYFGLEILYFNIAKKYRFVDIPNQRSSHRSFTIRGAGIIFPISCLLPMLFFYESRYSFFVLGLIFISVISFFDDIRDISYKVKLPIHFTSVALMVISFNQFDLSILTYIILFVITVGVINAYNFMDGINGMTGYYSLVLFFTLFYINSNVQEFVDASILISCLSAVLVFLFFNSRKKAIAFSGDVGSISIAFIATYFIISLISKTNDVKWLLLLSVYGVDSVCTIIFRLFRKEHIFKAHRSHFYQFLTNEFKIGHIKVSVMYVLIQLILNLIIINFNFYISLYSTILLIVFYLSLRFWFEGSKKLFKNYN